MTQECPDCGSHFTTYQEPGGTVAGYTTPVIEVDVPGELEVLGVHMETDLRVVSATNNQELHVEVDDMAANGWEIRQIVYNPHRGDLIVVFERPHGWGGDYA